MPDRPAYCCLHSLAMECTNKNMIIIIYQNFLFFFFNIMKIITLKNIEASQKLFDIKILNNQREKSKNEEHHMYGFTKIQTRDSKLCFGVLPITL